MIPHFTDHAANERTYLAWVRTAISVMAFGFLARALRYLPDVCDEGGRARCDRLAYASLGMAGPGAVVRRGTHHPGATQRFYRNRRAIEAAESSPYGDYWIAQVMSALLIIMALFLMLYVARQIAALG